MGVLVEDLLFLARAGQGRPIAHEPVDLSHVAVDAVHDAVRSTLPAPIELETPDELTVVGDEGRLRQVFANLLSNALATHSARHARGRACSIRGRVGRDRGERRGPGLSADEAAHVFEPFYRPDPARGRVRTDDGSDAEQGTGLGLAIVAAIAEAHGGDVRVIEPTRGWRDVRRSHPGRTEPSLPRTSLPPMPVDTDGRTLQEGSREGGDRRGDDHHQQPGALTAKATAAAATPSARSSRTSERPHRTC